MKFAGLNIRKFKSGGIRPDEHKHITENLLIENFHIPKKAVIPLSQHLGKPAKSLVKKGDTVIEGQIIGEKDGMISANVHSSIPGKVIDVGNYPVLNRLKVLSVVIQLEGEFKKGARPKDDWEHLEVSEILKRIEDAGIVGMGGATFPTNVKYSPPPDKNIDSLIINGVECEPYLTSDYRLMIEKSDEIIEGIKIVKKVLNVKNVYIGIELNKKKAIKKIKDRVAKNDNIKVVPLRVRYPQGAEKQLIKAVLNREVPSGGLPFDVGVIVSNVATIYAVRDAVLFQNPLIERVVTISGDIVEKPGNYKIKIGTLVSDIIQELGVDESKLGKIVFGGPMMGISVPSKDVPVTKGTSGILFLSREFTNKVDYTDYSACIHCGKCVLVCPMRLNPSMLSILAENKNWQDMKEFNILDCIECGSCSYVCPAQRPIVQMIKLGKSFIRLSKEK